VPVTDPKARRKRIVLQGEVPSPINPRPGAISTPAGPIRKLPLLRHRKAAAREEARRPTGGVPFAQLVSARKWLEIHRA